ncbi:hypothetical protein EVAR_90838_1 [Eumeta japonica]|uniref:Uncharacterized protein n=1 Tax=Eumeta variegata TaxID=151549 RepID=A0A4C1ZR39_EUMVA|nr:hypothetical protein EVAR_90838_1 [Eumeta japonica]
MIFPEVRARTLRLAAVWRLAGEQLYAFDCLSYSTGFSALAVLFQHAQGWLVNDLMTRVLPVGGHVYRRRLHRPLSHDGTRVRVQPDDTRISGSRARWPCSSTSCFDISISRSVRSGVMNSVRSQLLFVGVRPMNSFSYKILRDFCKQRKGGLLSYATSAPTATAQQLCHAGFY